MIRKNHCSIKDILSETEHRPWQLPGGHWKYYQEWNDAVFLHWQVNLDELQKFVPDELSIDLYQGKPWVSVVAFNMEKISPRIVPAFPPISNFYELNIRTYVKHRKKTGVYFLSIEGGKKASCKLAKALSALPYRYSDMHRKKNQYHSTNAQYNDMFNIEYEVGKELNPTTPLDQWLIERYALFQDTRNTLNAFDIHHLPWPVYHVTLNHIEVNYPRFGKLLNNQPDKIHYSPGAKVIAWGKKMIEQLKYSHP